MRVISVELLVVIAIIGILAVGGLALGGCFGRDLLESHVLDIGVVAMTMIAWVGCFAKYRRAKT
jgi:hypothetical protein